VFRDHTIFIYILVFVYEVSMAEDENTDSMKIGARNNAGDKATVREIRKAARTIVEHTMSLEPDDEDKPKEEHQGSQYVKGADMVIELPEIMLQWVTVKAGADEWTLDVLGVPFGGPFDGRDRDKQYFDDKTEILSAHYKTIPAVYGHGLTPDGKRAANPEIVGTASYSHKDERGHWYKVVLNQASKLAARLWDAAKKGAARASSGSIAHMVRIDANGHIAQWPVAEMTLVDVGSSSLIPANPYAVALPVMKALYDAAGLQLSEQQPEAKPAGGETQPGAADKQPIKTVRGVIEMDEKELLDLLDKRDAAKATAAAEAEKAAQVEELRKENEAMKAKLAEMNRLPGGVAKVAKWADTNKYDHLSAEDLALALDMQSNIHRTGRGSAPSMSAIKALALKAARIEQEKVSVETEHYVKAAVAPIFGGLDDDAIKAATDPAYSTLGSAGDEWIGVVYSNQIWEAIRANVQVISKIPTKVIPDGYESNVIPVESTDPTWYKVAQTTAADSTMKFPVASVPASQMATANKSLTVAKMGARAMYTGELAEDSIIAYVPQLRGQLTKSGAEMMEMVVIDGDTAVSSNINDIGGTTYSGNANSLFLLTNGFRKSPLVTTTGQSRSAAGAFVAEDFLLTLKLLGSNGVGASDPTKCAFIVDPNTWYASAQLPEAKDKNQTVFTVDGGLVTRAYLVEVIPSWFMHYASATRKANTAGKVDQDTVGNNLYGGILAVRFDQWLLGYKRRMTMETTRFANSDSWEITALTRWGVAQRDTLAAAETYYVGV
jgi:hypothetical protein